MKKLLMLICALLTIAQFTVAQNHPDNKKNLDWWQDSKFGLFVHWGLYSVAGGDWKGKPSKGNEHFMLYERVPVKEYAQIANDFNPQQFSAEQWVKLAKDAGMKYVVFTSKHHDGYAMYDSPVSDYNIVKTTKFKRDPIKELAAACKKHGLKLGIYYSLGRDWEDPDVPTNWPTKGGRSNTWDFPDEDAKDISKYFERKVKPQIKELLTKYGPIAIMWFDTPDMMPKKLSAELREFIRDIQPECIVNSRIGNGYGDYEVLEQKIATERKTKLWESCITMSGKWSYNRHDNAWKSPELLVRQLTEIVSRGGNLLLNINPTGEGAVLPEAQDRLAKIGEWMTTNNEAIYGTKQWSVNNEGVAVEKEIATTGNDKKTMLDTDNDNTSKKIAADICYTAKDNTVYLFARSWVAQNVLSKALTGTTYKVKTVALLGYSKKLKWKQDDNGLQISLPKELPNKIPVHVFKITL